MPKTKHSESALYEWTFRLTFQQQALLMTAFRGPDGCDKHNPGKCMTRYFRGAICKPAGNWSYGNDNDFMWGNYSVFDLVAKDFFDDPDGYPHHYLMHLFHPAEILGYKHPDKTIRQAWADFYLTACKSLHMHPESEAEMDERLNDFGVPIPVPTPAPVEGREKERLESVYQWVEALIEEKYPYTGNPEEDIFISRQRIAARTLAYETAWHMRDSATPQLPVSDTGEKPEPSPEALEAAARSKHSLSEVIDNQEAPEPFDLIAWCAEETKYLAQRDKDFFYMGSGDLYRYLSGKGMLTEPDDTWHHKVDRMYEVICTGEDYEKELQAEISSLKDSYSIVTADWNEEKNALQAELSQYKEWHRIASNVANAACEQVNALKAQIELLRKNGASLRPGISILDVLKWGNEKIDRRYQGEWVMKFHLLAFTDEKIVEEFLKDFEEKNKNNQI